MHYENRAFTGQISSGRAQLVLARSFIAYQGIHFLFSLAGEGGSRRSRDSCEDEDRTKVQRRNLNMNGNIVRHFEQIL